MPPKPKDPPKDAKKADAKKAPPAKGKGKAPNKAAAAKAEDSVARHLEGKTMIKEVYVPGRLVNFVAR